MNVKELISTNKIPRNAIVELYCEVTNANKFDIIMAMCNFRGTKSEYTIEEIAELTKDFPYNDYFRSYFEK